MRIAVLAALLLAVAVASSADARISRGLQDTARGHGWVMKYTCSTDYVTVTGTDADGVYVVETCGNYRWCRIGSGKCRPAAPWARAARTRYVR